ncbi:MAG: NADPH-dependent ferric siderophore reductase [Bordetella sp. SCN 67-23]|nr:siderophore-interacting protein [Burkholderiales bacterium]ODS76187.1 MAG: NADPH-dependent ferric siderophore reductase [Bordetella sp. SCN 67-23]OJW93662.1 MAG: NADPH-dependent ferric siderophore reductase [Burkholderiales bacterium 67-32]
MEKTERAVRRVRHELKFRLLRVRAVRKVTPRLLRVTLEGGDLAGFSSAAYDDHVKLFFPAPGQERPVVPTPGPNGMVFPEDQPRPAARDYTPRRYDAEAGELDIEFALHGDGPAAEWAQRAEAGQYLGVGGPRGSFVMEGEFDGYLLVGDETALPAIARRLEELPAGARAVVVAEVADAAEQQSFDTRADVEVRWVHRDGVAPGRPELLAQAVAELGKPRGDWYAWIAAESGVAKRVRQVLVESWQLPKEWIKAAGYWKLGAVATHDKHED